MKSDELLEKYFESIDFLPLGEKLASLNEAIASAKRAEEPETMKALRKKLGEEIRKLNEMRTVFKAYSAKINDHQLSAISCPDMVTLNESEFGVTGIRLFCFTSELMGTWFEKNIPKNMLPFRNPTTFGETEEAIIRCKAFGIALLKEEKKKTPVISTIQPLVFFRRSDGKGIRIGKGIRQPLKKAHLLMLFLILKWAKEHGHRSVIVDMDKINSEHPTEIGVYKEIAAVATEYIQTYAQAFFKKN